MGEEGLECDIHVDGVRLKHLSEFNYESSVNDGEFLRKVASERRVTGYIRALVNARGL